MKSSIKTQKTQDLSSKDKICVFKVEIFRKIRKTTDK